jgi:putative resolvase
VEAALSGHGRRLLVIVVVDVSEVDENLVWDVMEVLMFLRARPYGRRSAANRAKRTVEAATGDAR